MYILHALVTVFHLIQDYKTDLLKLEAERRQGAWEEMRRRVTDLEEDLKDSVRREERTKLDSLRQLQEVKGELITTRAKVEKERERQGGIERWKERIGAGTSFTVVVENHS